MTIKRLLRRHLADRLTVEFIPERKPSDYIWNGPLAAYDIGFERWIKWILMPAMEGSGTYLNQRARIARVAERGE